MSNWTPAIIVLTVVLVAGSIALILNRNSLQKNQISPSPFANIENEKLQVPVEIKLETDQKSYSVNDQILYTVHATVGNNYIAAVELNLNFDPNLLTVSDVLPGELFVNPNIIRNTKDQKNGVIEYALGSLKPKLGNGEILKIKARLNTSSPVANVLHINQSKTSIALIDENYSPLGEHGVSTQFTEIPFTILP